MAAKKELDRASSTARGISASGPMPAGAARSIILCMSATPNPTRRALVEVATPQTAVAKDPVVRRYRLARVSLYARQQPVPQRFAHLRRSYD